MNHEHLSCVSKVPIFNNLTEAEKEDIILLAKHTNLDKGDFVFQAGNLLNSLYVVYKGQVKISRYSPDGKEQVIRILSNGEFFGELTMFTNKTIQTFAEAIEPTVICKLNGDDVKNLLKTNPDVGLKIISELSNRLTVAEEMIEFNTLSTSDAKLARLLLNLNKNGRVTFPTTKTNLASQIGITSETFSRKLKQFHEKHIIEIVSNKVVVIKDLNLLENIIFYG